MLTITSQGLHADRAITGGHGNVSNGADFGQPVDAHSNLGNLYKVQGDLSAKRCYLEAVRINPGFAIAWSNLAGVFKDRDVTNC